MGVNVHPRIERLHPCDSHAQHPTFACRGDVRERVPHTPPEPDASPSFTVRHYPHVFDAGPEPVRSFIRIDPLHADTRSCDRFHPDRDHTSGLILCDLSVEQIRSGIVSSRSGRTV